MRWIFFSISVYLQLQCMNIEVLCFQAHEVKGNKAEAVKYLKLSLKHDETNSKVSFSMYLNQHIAELPK